MNVPIAVLRGILEKACEAGASVSELVGAVLDVLDPWPPRVGDVGPAEIIAFRKRVAMLLASGGAETAVLMLSRRHVKAWRVAMTGELEEGFSWSVVYQLVREDAEPICQSAQGPNLAICFLACLLQALIWEAERSGVAKGPALQ